MSDTSSTPDNPPASSDAADALAEAAAPTSKKVMEERWGHNTIKAGYTFVPSLILRAQARLHINAVELAVLLHLLDHWWDNADMPFPAKQRLAERLGVSTKTVQRAVAALETEGLIQRVKRHNGHGGQGSNYYDFAPLIEKLKPIAEEALEAKKKAAELRRSVGRNGGLKSWEARQASAAGRQQA
jgi:predicted transcriptional regulator